jgi:hypothetical protein
MCVGVWNETVKRKCYEVQSMVVMSQWQMSDFYSFIRCYKENEFSCVNGGELVDRGS